jgi:proteic killer suppression protein
VDIKFGNKNLEKLANDSRKCFKALGQIRGKLFLKRLNDILDAETLEQLRNAPGNFHELSGNRKGQWACNLDQPYRLVFTPQENPIPTNDYGHYIWIKILGVEILEIVDYH